MYKMKGEINMKKDGDFKYEPNAVVEVTKEFTFDSAHFLEEYKGKCANLHGHTYKLQVTLEGVVDRLGMVIDFNVIKDIVKREVIDILDHKELNYELPNFNTTAENMSVWIYNRISTAGDLPQRVRVKSIKLWETPTSYAEYKGVNI